MAPVPSTATIHGLILTPDGMSHDADTPEIRMQTMRSIGWCCGRRTLTSPMALSLRFAPPRHAPRGVLLGRHTTRYPYLVGLAIHALNDAKRKGTWVPRH
jgi:hypothetical protein